MAHSQEAVTSAVKLVIMKEVTLA
jgi:hypothetical protein